MCLIQAIIFLFRIASGNRLRCNVLKDYGDQFCLSITEVSIKHVNTLLSDRAFSRAGRWMQTNTRPTLNLSKNHGKFSGVESSIDNQLAAHVSQLATSNQSDRNSTFQRWRAKCLHASNNMVYTYTNMYTFVLLTHRLDS